MVIRPIARDTTAPTYTCASENPYCLSIQRVSNNDTSSPATGTTAPTQLLTHRNLVGVLVIAALLALGLILWLCFGKWSKPIRHFLRGEQRHNNINNNNVRFGIGDGLAAAPIDRNRTGATATTSKAPPGPYFGSAADSDIEKAEIVDSSSSSTQNSLDQEGIEIDKDKEDKEETKANPELEPALPAKVRRPVLSWRERQVELTGRGLFGRYCMRLQSSLAVSLHVSVDNLRSRNQPSFYKVDQRQPHTSFCYTSQYPAREAMLVLMFQIPFCIVLQVA